MKYLHLLAQRILPFKTLCRWYTWTFGTDFLDIITNYKLFPLGAQYERDERKWLYCKMEKDEKG
ncbi:hypothetical protein LCGC14_1969450 [marine sediment metagenome]|uniref:Uncharacterized protein n=1 Tax=marine sediment metagenome TaxID=412755 RepID=A0A0F9HQM7_9ZZZZ